MQSTEKYSNIWITNYHLSVLIKFFIQRIIYEQEIFSLFNWSTDNKMHKIEHSLMSFVLILHMLM